LKAFGVTEEDLKKHGDDLVVDRLSELLDSSKYVRMAVVLAMDGVVTDGELDTSLTQVYVPNKFVSKAVKRHDNLLFGASVNPYRRDALEELKRVEADGAVLVKWIPSVMNIDPSDPKIIPFYEKLKELKLPLLTHTGLDQSFPCSLNLCPNHILADPERLRLPLKKGVKVIAAHVASTGTYEGEDSHIRLVRMMREYDNLYADISTLTQWNKHGYMCEALTRQEFTDRLYYGSDFPLINSRLVKPWYQRLWLTKSQINSICKERNPWDRDVLIKQALGTPTDVFTKSQEFLRP
jgi:predicted TIM-barrel fold metal-dependent hydrolase